MVCKADESAPARVGKFEFHIEVAESDSDANERWARRSDAIAAWLMAQWEREQRRRMAERN